MNFLAPTPLYFCAWGKSLVHHTLVPGLELPCKHMNITSSGAPIEHGFLFWGFHCPPRALTPRDSKQLTSPASLSYGNQPIQAHPNHFTQVTSSCPNHLGAGIRP